MVIIFIIIIVTMITRTLGERKPPPSHRVTDAIRLSAFWCYCNLVVTYLPWPLFYSAFRLIGSRIVLQP